jgi:tRNA(fMet)-specific endonuclease VapC
MYLLDTNIIVFLFKGNENITKRIKKSGLKNCFISEITIAELKYGAEKSKRPDYHKKLISDFVEEVNILPIFNCLDVYASEKTRLELIGNRLDDFDLLIGATAVFNDLILVTNNVKHLGRIENVKTEDWS